MRFNSTFFFAAGASALSLGGAVGQARAQTPVEVSVSSSTSPASSDAHVQLGLFGGVLLLPSESTLRDPGLPAPEYETSAFLVGLRAGAYPLPFLGVEVEGAYAPTATDDGESARLFALRGHAIAQIPTPGITPFVLGGYGRFFADSRSLGDDDDRAFHFGGGVKAPMGEDVSVRVDVRDTIVADSVGDAGHYPE
ncbi:MAG TPA: outer membrane beta-barrel protein, partial [Polyangiaceae bacterium]